MSKVASGKKRSADTGIVHGSKKIKLHKGSLQSSKPPRSSSDRPDVEEGYDGSDSAGALKALSEDPADQDTANDNVHPSRRSSHHSAEQQQGKDGFLNGTSSREAHQKQKQLAQERKAAKPNSDSIFRTKKIWERLRIKSAVPKDEREKLVAELFKIITGRVKDFVFKHDSVRVIQCALKYATPAQKRQIANELKGSYRELAESKYAKFLVAKLVVGDNEVRDMVVPEFYGHVKRLMRHPEASWIVDDIYRGLATKEQKARLLREWYGAEFVLDAQIEQRNKGGKQTQDAVTAELSEILKQTPEKKGSIMQHLREMTNQLVQKKTTGFTMLHDALLQYYLNTTPGSPEANEFLEMLKDDEEGDLIKNLAFTKSGSRLVCLALANGNSKDRRVILKIFKTHIKLLSSDAHGHQVLLTAYEVIDDTVMASKAIFSELLGKDLSEEEKINDLLGQVTHLTARIPLLYLLAPEVPKWLVTDEDTAVIEEVRQVRTATSKKDPETRRVELVKTISQPLLDLIASQAASLAGSSFGCQFIVEVLLGAIGEKQAALEAVAALATPETEEGLQLVGSAHAGRMFKSLVQGGRFDKASKSIVVVQPPLNFHNLLYQQLHTSDAVLSWAAGPNSFAIVAMLEASDFDNKAALEQILGENMHELQNPRSDDKAAHAGAKILLEKIGNGKQSTPSTKAGKKSKKSKST